MWKVRREVDQNPPCPPCSKFEVWAVDSRSKKKTDVNLRQLVDCPDDAHLLRAVPVVWRRESKSLLQCLTEYKLEHHFDALTETLGFNTISVKGTRTLANAYKNAQKHTPALLAACSHPTLSTYTIAGDVRVRR